jgi:hypothetical protein
MEDPELLNNLAALKHMEVHPGDARELYEQALTIAAKRRGVDDDYDVQPCKMLRRPWGNLEGSTGI